MSYAGKLSADVTSNFESIHDEYAHKKLQECCIGKVTAKASKFMKEQAKQAAEEAAKSGDDQKKVLLQKKSWTRVKLIDHKGISEDTFLYKFKIPGEKSTICLGTCQHVQFGIHLKDKMLIRSYTPTSPILAKTPQNTIELKIKTYFPNTDQPGGALSNLHYTLPIGKDVEVCGPTSEIEYLDNGKFDIEGKTMTFNRINLILGGSGVTPGYQLIANILEKDIGKDKDGKEIKIDDKTQLRIIDANKTEDDILMREQLDDLQKKHKDQLKITHVLSHPKDDKKWQVLKGHVNADIIKKNCFEPQEGGTAVFLCGPPAMIQKAALPALTDWGFEEEKNCFGF